MIRKITLILLIFLFVFPSSQRVYSNNKTPNLTQVIANLNHKENIIREKLLQGKSKKYNDKVFNEFYNNLMNAANTITLNLSIDDSQYYKHPYLKYDEFRLKGTKDKYGYDNPYIFEYPKTELLFFLYSYETQAAHINLKYLTDNYSKFLSKSWQDFLYLEQKYQDNDMCDASLCFSYDKLIDVIIDWREFIKKYPDFTENTDIEQSIEFYTSELIFNFYNFDYENNTITPESKAAYERFLKEADKNTKEYEVVKNCYNSLKKHNFKESLEFHKYLYEYHKHHPWIDTKKDLYLEYRKKGKISHPWDK